MKSMTGYARRELRGPSLDGTVEIKSWNNRYLEMSLFLPPYLGPLDPLLRELVGALVVHGKVEVTLRVRELRATMQVAVDREAARSCYRTLAELALYAGAESRVQLSDILRFDGIISMSRDIDSNAIWDELHPQVSACLDDFDAARSQEGKRLESYFLDRLATMADVVKVFKAASSRMEASFRDQLARKVSEAVGPSYDENRVLAEVALTMARLTIGEEIARLDSHLAAFRKAASEAAPGKKLDFICQEMNREVNTVGSKNVFVDVSEAVVTAKDAIESIREQLRNIE